MKDRLIMNQSQSDSPSYDVFDEEKGSIYVLKGIRLNPGVTKLNFFCCLIFSVITLFGTSGVNGIQLLILLDPKYYNVSQSSAGSINSLVLIVQASVAIIMSVPYGHLVDTVGRRMLVTIGAFSFLLGCLLLPTQKSIIPGFVMAFILITNASTAFQSLPLMADYVAEESRGRAFATSAVVVGLAVLIPNLLTKYLLYADVPLGICYYIFGISAFVGLLINNIGLKKGTFGSKKQEDGEKKIPEKPFWQRMKEAYNIFKSNNWLKISLVLQVLAASDFTIFMSYLSLYVKSLFPDGSADGNTLVNNLQTILITLMMVCVPLYGFLLDKKNMTIQLCLFSLIGGAGALTMFSFVTQATDYKLYLGTFIFGSTLPGLATITNIITFKHYPAEKRGLMVGFAQFVTNCSYFVLAIGSGYLYDHWKRNGPFMVCAGMLSLATIVISLIYCRIPKEQKGSEISSTESKISA